METKTKLGVGILVSVLFLAGAVSTQALSGNKANDVKVKIFTKPLKAKH